MNKRECINLDGLLQYENRILERATHHDDTKLIDFIINHSIRLRNEYCALKCPNQQLCKYNARYWNGKV